MPAGREEEGEEGSNSWYCANAGSTTHPVGQKQVNAWFLSDMAGNVWEWCNDWLEGHLGSSGATNPVGASSGTFRVARGGSWNGYAETLRAAFRNVDYPTGEHLTIGLRVARTQ